MSYYRNPLVTLVLLLSFAGTASGQQARISTETMSLTTYPFNDPDPVPILTSNTKIYPYFTFDGYTHTGRPQDWQVVHLENEYIELWVLPQAGGKVWGAREKSTGEEFIYRNEVIKFRNIAMRGPWTSGGIEFNFGIIGHHPSTASPVDYEVVEEADGSVSCWVGNMDLSSRTQWRVKIRLPKDKAWFETQVFWYNPSPLHQSYYNWMTGAAFATDDLEMYCPGDQYLEHNGDAHPWPEEYGRHIAAYSENNFLSHKSYHVVGEYNDFFGGYYHDKGYGFGHWSPYDEMPGQKIWLWSLARDGGIWEDLLTDTDGQYIEFQAGRLFNQYSPGGGKNPITQAVFPPHTSDRWREVWFPVKDIGGLTDVSPTAVLHLTPKAGKMTIGINALETAGGTLRVTSEDQVLLEKPIRLSPMEVFTETLNWPDPDKHIRVSVAEMDLDYDSDPGKRQLKRPFEKARLNDIPPAETHFRAGLEWMDFREYARAAIELQACLQEDPAHLEALSALAELHYRQGRYDQGLEYALRALAIDTYHPYANFVGGILFQAQNDLVNAREMLGWAARSMAYRSAAYVVMAETYLTEGKNMEAVRYAGQALDYNRYNIRAHQIMAIANRLQGKPAQAKEWTEALLQLDPLCHFARFERSLLQTGEASKKAFRDQIHNEFPYQTYLEIALTYAQLGQKQTALEVLAQAPSQALITIWQAYLQQDTGLLQKALAMPADFVFPYRRESLPALEWAKTQSDHWKARYYLALNYWGNNRLEEATQLLESIDKPTGFPAFYLTRANLREKTNAAAALSDLEEARRSQPDSWRSLHELSQYYHRQGMVKDALAISKNAYEQFPASYTAGMDYVRGLIFNEQYESAVQVLDKLQVLPFEGASEGRQLYEWAYLGLAQQQIRQKAYDKALLSLQKLKEWPERLGVGKPFDPDERLADHLLAQVYTALKDPKKTAEARARILDFTRKFPLRNSANAVLGYRLMEREELSGIMIHLFANETELSPALQWAMAAALQETTKAKTILEAHPNVSKGLGFGFLQSALALP